MPIDTVREDIKGTIKSIHQAAESAHRGATYPVARSFYEKTFFKGQELPPVIDGLPLFEGKTMDQWMIEREKDGPFTILDIGCGNGNSLRTIKEKHNKADVLGISIRRFEPLQIELSRLTIGDASFLSKHYSPNSFDFIYSYETFRWVGRPFVNLLPKIYRVLKPEGKAFLDTANIWPIDGIDDLSLLQRWLGEQGYQFEFNLGRESSSEIRKCSFKKTASIKGGSLFIPVTYYTDPFGNLRARFDEGKAADIAARI